MDELNIHIPQQIKDIAKLHDPVEFNKRFNEKLPEYRTYEQAYQAVEAEYTVLFGARKYSSYNSFRVVRYKAMKKVF